MDKTSIGIIKSISNLQEDFIVLFEGDSVIFTNSAFNRYFNVSSTEQYNEKYGEFVKHFVPHPNYFNKDKIEGSQNWIDAICKLDENDRIVSMLSLTYEPNAFGVSVDRSVEDYSVVVFKDITQDLIKRIMIQNHANIDKESGAYDKKYFQQIAKTYQDAADFNEKIIATLSIVLTGNSVDYRKFVESLVEIIRQDDMLVRWSENRFVLVFMIDELNSANMVLSKFKKITSTKEMQHYGCKLKLTVADKDEKITTLIKRI